MARTYWASLFLGLMAQGAVAANMQSHCIALSQNLQGLRHAALGEETALANDEVRLHYVGHSTYVLQTHGGVHVATDYAGYAGMTEVPDVVTMNHAHETHFTHYPSPDIKHVLRGWGGPDGPAEHRLDLDEILIRNVTTDIRSGYGGVARDDNSIFIFEVAGLCIGHLGHLHHEPSDAQYAMIGRLDVVMAPVDGGMTLDTQTMVRVLKRLRASVVLPMHWFGETTRAQFLQGMSDEFKIVRPEGNAVTVSLRNLPREPTVYVLDVGVVSP